MRPNQDISRVSTDREPILQYDRQQSKTSNEVLQRPNRLWRFIARNPQVPASFCAGLLCCLGSFIFTWWLSAQDFQCPEWALKCEIGDSVTTFSKNLGLVQGIVTTIYGLGLAGLTFAAYSLSEAAVWPLLKRQSYNRLDQLDSYLSASRGSLTSLPLTYPGVRNIATFILVVCLSITSITPLISSPVVGWVYNKQNVTREFESQYRAGGGLGIKFTQHNPQRLLPMPAVYASELYNAWSRDIAEDPMPEARDFILDRLKLAKVGNFSVRAVRAHKEINCTGRTVDISDTDSDTVVLVQTTGNISSKNVELRLQPKLTLWVDDIQYKSEYRAVSTLVFAIFNATISNGSHTDPTERMAAKGFNGLSAVACSVDVTLSNSVFTLGEADEKHVGLASLLKDLEVPSNSSRTELAVWLGVAPVTFGVSVNGTQPAFEIGDRWLRTFAWSSSTLSPDTTFDINILKRFIRDSSGAMAQGMSQKVHRIAQNRVQTTRIHSRLALPQLENSRSFYLLILPLIMLAVVLVLALWDEWMYRKTELTVMRLANVGELIRSAQTSDMRAMTETGDEMSSLSKQRVRYVQLSELGDHGFTSQTSIDVERPERRQ